MRPLTPRRIAAICALLAGVLFVVVVFSLKVGAYPISVSDVAMTLVRGALGHWNSIPSSDRLIVFGLRLPRIALGILVGAALSVSGASFQALLRNPLADPYVLGVSSGAALGAILALVWLPQFPWAMQGLAFLGALATIAAVYFLGRRKGQLDSTTLLLAGIITASFLSAIIMFLMTTVSGRDLRGMAFWLMGDSGNDAGDQSGISVLRSADRNRRDLHHVVGFEFDFDGRAGSASSGRECSARETGGVRQRVAAYGPGRFRQRRNRIRRLADSACDAHAFRLRLSRADSRVGDRRSDCGRARRYAGAHRRCSHRASRRRSDGGDWRARIYLFVAAEIRMSAQGMPAPNAARDTAAGWMQNAVRLVVEQASYAYSASDRDAPDFTLGPVTFSARQREACRESSDRTPAANPRCCVCFPENSNRCPAAWNWMGSRRANCRCASARNGSRWCIKKAR